MTGLPSRPDSGRLSVSSAFDIIKRQRRPSSSNRQSLAISDSESVETSDTNLSAPVKKQRSSSSLRGIFKKLRSSSSSITLADDSLVSLQESEFKQIDDWFSGFDRYNQLVTTQVSKNQTYPSEAFNKITGILTKNCGGRFIHALPEAVFDHALLWCPAIPGARKDDEGPSWSWTNWNGQVNFPFDPTNAPDLQKRDGVLLKSEIEHFIIGSELISSQYTVRREKSPELRIEYPPWFHAPWGKDIVDYANILRFKAYTIPADKFIMEQIKYEGKPIPCSFLNNDEKKHCGVIMDFEDSLAEPSSQGPYDFVLLSRSLRKENGGKNIEHPTTRTIHPPGTPIWDGEHFVWHQEVCDFDEKVYEEGPWKMLNVMLIQWVGEEAKRVAIGRIHEDEWKKHNPKKEQIVLR